MSITAWRTGHDRLVSPIGMMGLILTISAVVFLGLRLGVAVIFQLNALLVVVPVALIVLARPVLSLYMLILLCFLANGISRYVNAPWGLLIDATLVLGWLVTLARRYPRNLEADGDPRRWPELAQDGFVLSFIWFAYVILELVNPASLSVEAWFYAMRSVGLYQILGVGLAYFHLRSRKQLQNTLHLILWLSIAGAIWGMRQKFIGLDAAEEHWLYAEDHAKQHVLFGVLRTFSFYSDAGQFGASQAMVFLMAGIMAIRPPSEGWRVFYIVAALLCFIGFGISGTRGALAVPAAGGLMYLVVSRNIKILVLGLIAMASVYGILRYTSMFHTVQQVQRMRTALDPNEPSLMVRLENQAFLARQLADKPFGAGIGSSGFWGTRFTPHTVFAQTATDSYYVRLWVETGIIGLGLHLLILGYFLGAGTYRTWFTEDPVLRHQRAAMLCGYAGMLLASYGNQVLNQFPTALIVSITVPVILSEHWAKQPE